jgi:HAD superfamily hydrolase (TIGR01509 family)
MSIRGVIFDVDGTLVDSNDAHAHAWVDVLREHGSDVPFDRVRPLIGMGGDKLLPSVTELDARSTRAKAISERRSQIFQERYLPSLRAFPGAGDLLRRLRAHGLTLVVASSAKEEELELLLALTGAADAFAAETSSDDVERSKPDPDVVHQALARLRCRPDEAVMIGDTPYDRAASANASVAFIGFRCGGWGDRDLRGAVAIYDGPWHLHADFARSALSVLAAANEHDPRRTVAP